jgi:MFS transporter, DHA1 family, multidrug resistance protein
MHTTERAAQAPPPQAPRWARFIVPADYTLFHVGYLGALPLMPVILRSLLGLHHSLAVGAVLLVYNAAIGIACLFAAPVIARVDARKAMAAGLGCSAAGIGLLPFAHSALAAGASLALAGSGMSVHGVTARSMVAKAVPDDASRHRIFSSIQIGVNIAAAIGPLIATSVYAVSGDKAVLWGACAFYLAGMALVLARVPAGVHVAQAASRWPLTSGMLRQLLSLANAQICIATSAGYFLYAQFFSAIALLITLFVAKGPIQGVLFVENAVLIVGAQAPVSSVVQRLLNRGTHPSAVMLTGMAIFAFALLVLGVMLALHVPVFASAAAAIALFSLAETVYAPTVNTAFAQIPASSPVESFNVQQTLQTLGQSAGTLVGTSVFLAVAGTGTGSKYWLVLAIAGLMVAGGTAAADASVFRLFRPSSVRRTS